jgi:hypothetical protein
MTMAVATTFTPVMALLTGNAGGAIQSLPGVNLNGGRQRSAVGMVALAAQASGSTIGAVRLPISPGGTVITGITIATDTSLATAQISLGDSNSAAKYMAAQTLTSLNTPTRVGLATIHGALLTSGYDCASGAISTAYEDIVIVTSVAALPGSGTLVVIVEYVVD